MSEEEKQWLTLIKNHSESMKALHEMILALQRGMELQQKTIQYIAKYIGLLPEDDNIALN